MTDEELEAQTARLQQAASEIGHRMLMETLPWHINYNTDVSRDSDVDVA